jgi:hypothetical protein
MSSDARAPGFWNIAGAALAPYLGTRAQSRDAVRATVALPNGEVGYCMEPGRPDGCLAPALATVLQVPVGEVPDPHIYEARAAAPPAVSDDLIVEAFWTALEVWLDDRGLEAVTHYPAPVHLDRWIAACTPPLELLGASVIALPDGRAARGRDLITYLVAARTAIALDDAEVARALEDVITAVRFGSHALVMCRDRVYHDPAVGLEPPPGQRHCSYEIEDVIFGVSFNPKE